MMYIEQNESRHVIRKQLPRKANFVKPNKIYKMPHSRDNERQWTRGYDHKGKAHVQSNDRGQWEVDDAQRMASN